MTGLQLKPTPDVVVAVPRGMARILADLAHAVHRYRVRPLPALRGAAFTWLGAAGHHLYRARRALHTNNAQKARARLLEVAALALAAIATLDQLNPPEQHSQGP